MLLHSVPEFYSQDQLTVSGNRTQHEFMFNTDFIQGLYKAWF